VRAYDCTIVILISRRRCRRRESSTLRWRRKRRKPFVSSLTHPCHTLSHLNRMLPLINHLKGIEGQLDKLVKAECVSSTSAVTPPSSSPMPQQSQQPWRPRGVVHSTTLSRQLVLGHAFIHDLPRFDRRHRIRKIAISSHNVLQLHRTR